MEQKTDKETIEKAKNLIRDLIDLDSNTEIEFNDVGWTSRVYIINNGEIVFKFPRSEKIKEEYRFEVIAYELAEQIDSEVLIPKIEWKHPNLDYVGYKGVIGEGLDVVISKLSDSQKKNLGEKLGKFLKQLHHLNIEDASLMSQEKECAEYAYKLDLGLTDLTKYFNEAEIRKIKKLILEEYPAKIKELGFTKGLCHADLGYWNMIYGPDDTVGIIDFGDVGYYDTSIDFAGMNDEVLLESALNAYGEEISREKIDLRLKIIPILDLPFFTGKKDQDGIERTVSRIREVTLN